MFSLILGQFFAGCRILAPEKSFGQSPSVQLGNLSLYRFVWRTTSKEGRDDDGNSPNA